MIASKDFVPKQLRKRGFIKPPMYETFQEAVTAAGVWLREQEVTIINVETVVLPGLWGQDKPRSGEGSLKVAASTGYATEEVYQFVRVWYKSE